MYLSLVLGLIIVARSSRWPLAWIGIEVNLIRFLCLIYRKANILVYFLAQSLGTLGILSRLFWGNVFLPIFLFLKLGLFPFYFWIVALILKERIWSRGILLTIQKIAPLTLIASCGTPLMILLINALAGGYLILARRSILLLLLFSGLIQATWVIRILPRRFAYTYFAVYVTLIIALLAKSPQSICFFLLFFALAGFPPFSGFMIKIYAIWLIPLVVVVELLLLAVISMYCYIRFIFYYYPKKKKPSVSTIFIILAGAKL